MTKQELTQIISKYVPEGTAEMCVNLLITHKIQLKLTKPRTSKYGDYRAPHKLDSKHRISVNSNLNPYSFITTFLHEVAHLTTFEKHKNRCAPHGKEWKQEFKNFLEPLIQHHQLPDDVSLALKNYMMDPSASSCSDKGLTKVLSRYDKDDKVLLEEIIVGTLFRVDTGKVFKKGDKLRTWFQCIEVTTGKVYKVSGVCKVIVVEG